LSPALIDALRLVAPGTALRAGLERILQAQQGALVVLTSGQVGGIRSGGFQIDTEMTEQRLSELAKMDGAIILSPDGGRILWANVQLMPSPDITTQETGTRHRTAERTAHQLGVPVIAVSEDMRTIGLYVHSEKYRLQSIPTLLQRADQALATLSRYRVRLDELFKNLSQLELQDLVTLEDVGDAMSRFEVVRRIADEIHSFVLELGIDGRLIQLQLDELMVGVDGEGALLVRDYARSSRLRSYERCLHALSQLDDDELWSAESTARVLSLDGEGAARSLSPRGYRLLTKIPRLPAVVVDGLVRRFESLQRVRKANLDELMEVDGVGEGRARNIAAGLERLAEAGLL